MKRYDLFALKIVGVIAIVVVVPALFMLLWNSVIPAVFPAVNPVGFWQALGLLLICKVLFGNFGGHRGLRDKRFAHLSEEERQQMRERFIARWKDRRQCFAKGEEKSGKEPDESSNKPQ